MEDHLRKLGRTGEEPLPVERVGTWEVAMLAASPPFDKDDDLASFHQNQNPL